MATTYGISTSEIYRQPGLSIGINEKGQIEGSAEYIIAKEQVNSILLKIYNGAYATTIDDNIPTWAANMRVLSHDITIDEGGFATIKVQYFASSGDQYDSTFPDPEEIPAINYPTYRLEGRLSEKSLTEHEKFRALSETQQTVLKELIAGTLIWTSDLLSPPTFRVWYPRNSENLTIQYEVTLTGDAVDFAKMIAGGMTTYVVPSVTWTETREGTSPMTSAQLNLLGKVSTPRGGPPTATGTRNWMLTGAGQEQKGTIDGAIYQTTIEWTLSDRDGWNDFLYD